VSKFPVLTPAVQHFDVLPENALVGANEYRMLSGRSMASFYRDLRSGALKMVKVGHSTKVRVGDLRRLLGIPSAQTPV